MLLPFYVRWQMLMPLVLSGVVPLGSCVVDVIPTMADGIAIFQILG